jgi:hypothetical protein
MFTKQSGTPAAADQVSTYIDWLASFDETWLRSMLKVLLWVVDAYTEVDKKIFGCGKYILMVLGLILAYLIFRVLSFVAGLVWVSLLSLYKLVVPATATATATASAAGAGAGAGGASFFSGSASSASAPVPAPLSPTASANLASSAAGVAASAAASAAAAAAASEGQNRGPIDGLKEKMGGFFSSLGGVKTGAGNKKPQPGASSASSSKQSDSMDSEF